MVNEISCITQIHIKNFRCFNERVIHFDAPVVLIQGANGTGKTSVLEALYYASYLRSFRSANPRELIADDADSFFIKVLVKGMDIDHHDEINVGFSQEKRLIKVNQQTVASYKELMSYYSVISVTEDDLALIKEGPLYRRDFLDQALALNDAEYVSLFKQMRETLETRNAALQNQNVQQGSNALYVIWTQQLWERSLAVQAKRIHFLQRIQDEVNALIAHYFASDFEIILTYEPKRMRHAESFAAFQARYPDLFQDELRFRRSLFGAHLDDILITFKGKKSRTFASRGQQKLVLILIKAAQIRLLLAHQKRPLVLLLDDFMTDFDLERTHLLIGMLADLKVQLIFTTPIGGYLEQGLANTPHQLVKLD